jgi:4'-phosphopantetheinyl transferase
MPQPSPMAEIVVWHIPLAGETLEPGAVQASLLAMLDPEEQSRALRHQLPENRRRYIAAHVAMRALLAACCDAEPSTLSFLITQAGKPILANGGPHFNLAHSGNYAVLAICEDAPVGADCEVLRDMPDCLDVAARFFAPEEQQFLATFPASHREAHFFRLWTAKEALLKGTGDGLLVALSAFALELESPSNGNERRLRLSRVDACARQLEGWNLVLDATVDGVQIAVACPLSAPLVRQQRLDWQVLLRGLRLR